MIGEGLAATTPRMIFHLTPRRAEALRAIRDLTRNGEPPSIRVIAHRVGRSKSAVHEILVKLVETGYVDIKPNGGAMCRHSLTEAGRRALDN